MQAHFHKALRAGAAAGVAPESHGREEAFEQQIPTSSRAILPRIGSADQTGAAAQNR